MDKKQQIRLIEIQKQFFKDIKEFDNYWYIRKIKQYSVKQCLKLYKMKLTPLEWIFSLKNKNEHEKAVTIFGIQFIFKRHNFD